MDSTFVSFLRRTDRIAAVPISVISYNTESAQENQRREGKFRHYPITCLSNGSLLGELAAEPHK